MYRFISISRGSVSHHTKLAIFQVDMETKSIIPSLLRQIKASLKTHGDRKDNNALISKIHL